MILPFLQCHGDGASNAMPGPSRPLLYTVAYFEPIGAACRTDQLADFLADQCSDFRVRVQPGCRHTRASQQPHLTDTRTDQLDDSRTDQLTDSGATTVVEIVQHCGHNCRHFLQRDQFDAAERGKRHVVDEDPGIIASACANTVASADGDTDVSAYDGTIAGACANRVAGTDADADVCNFVGTDACASTIASTNADTDADTVPSTDACAAASTDSSTDTDTNVGADPGTDAGAYAITVAITDADSDIGAYASTDAGCDERQVDGSRSRGVCDRRYMRCIFILSALI